MGDTRTMTVYNHMSLCTAITDLQNRANSADYFTAIHEVQPTLTAYGYKSTNVCDAVGNLLILLAGMV